MLGSADGFMGFQFGLDTDLPLRGDFDGDAKADLAVYRPAPANAFYILRAEAERLRRRPLAFRTPTRRSLAISTAMLKRISRFGARPMAIGIT